MYATAVVGGKVVRFKLVSAADATLRTDMLRERPARVKAPLRRFAALTRTGRSRLPGTYRSVAQE
jgi:hypothetical protein